MPSGLERRSDLCRVADSIMNGVKACSAAVSPAWDPSGPTVRLPSGWRGEAVGDRGCLEPVRRPELAQDVRDVDAGGLDADDERRGDLAVRVATGDQVQDLRLARGQAEDLPRAALCLGERGLRGREIEPRALGEQFDLPKQRTGPEPGRDCVRLPERYGRLGA